MTRWWAVAGLAGVVLLAILVLSRLSQRAITGEPQASSAPAEPGSERGPEWVPARVTHNGGDTGGFRRRSDLDRPEALPPGLSPGRGRGVESTSTRMLLANVALTQGLFLVVLAAGLFLLSVPPTAVGLSVPTAADLATGVALGVGLYLANEVGAAVADRAGLGHDERLRELLAPGSAAGWAVLLAVVLPVIAGFEELLFRGVLVGALAAGFPVSPWLLAVLSSVAFGVGHGAQGRTGVVVTGALGLVLAAGFVLTGSLVAVVVAHYLVNALEFVVHEGLDLEWTASTAG